MGIQQLVNGASVFLRKLDQAQVSLYMPEQPDKAFELLDVLGKHNRMPTFEISRSHLAAGDAFWMFLMRGTDPIGCVAVMLQDLRGETADTFLRRTYEAQFGALGADGLLSVSEPVGQLLQGRMAYIGELYIHETQRGGRGVLPAFFGMVQLAALAQWDVDGMYAMMRERHVLARLHFQYGFSTFIPDAQTWGPNPPPGRASSECLVFSNALQMRHFLRYRMRQIEAEKTAEAVPEGAEQN